MEIRSNLNEQQLQNNGNRKNKMFFENKFRIVVMAKDKKLYKLDHRKKVS